MGRIQKDLRRRAGGLRIGEVEGNVEMRGILAEEDLHLAAIAGEGDLACAGVLARPDDAIHRGRSAEGRVSHVGVAQVGRG